MNTNTTGNRRDWPRYPVFQVGMEIEFAGDLSESELPWKVRAISRSGRFVCCTKPLPSRGTVEYTVLDLRQGIRGPDNYHGLGYETDEDCREALECFEATVVYDELASAGLTPGGDIADDVDWVPAEFRDLLFAEYGLLREQASISRRNNVPIRIADTRADALGRVIIVMTQHN